MQTLDAQADDLLTDLQVLSMIPENGRLCLRNGNLSVESYPSDNSLGAIPSHLLLAIKRWWFHDNRNSAINHIQTTLSKSFSLVDELTKSSLHNKEWLLQQFKDKFINSQKGLKNMALTYNNDANTRAKIEVIAERLKNAINNIS